VRLIVVRLIRNHQQENQVKNHAKHVKENSKIDD